MIIGIVIEIFVYMLVEILQNSFPCQNEVEGNRTMGTKNTTILHIGRPLNSMDSNLS
jgi:hypothetical protein